LLPPTLFPYTTLFRSHVKRSLLLLGVRRQDRHVNRKVGDEVAAVESVRRAELESPATRFDRAVCRNEKLRVRLALGEHISFVGEDRKSTRLNSSHQIT